MMGYLERLKSAHSEKCLPLPLPKPSKAPYGSFDSRVSGRFQGTTPLVRFAEAVDATTVLRWWLIHYPDREPVQVACYPGCTHAEILELRPDASAAEPINHAKPKPSCSCSTCDHITGRGGCGEPVAAGLSALEGVIRYHPEDGSGCSAWLAVVPADLEERIRLVIQLGHYSNEDRAGLLDAARSDAYGLRLALETAPL